MVEKKESKRDSWRLSAETGAGRTLDAESTTGFDEIVVGAWLHLERMDDDCWWLRLGDREADIVVRTDGRCTVRWRPKEEA